MKGRIDTRPSSPNCQAFIKEGNLGRRGGRKNSSDKQVVLGIDGDRGRKEVTVTPGRSPEQRI